MDVPHIRRAVVGLLLTLLLAGCGGAPALPLRNEALSSVDLVSQAEQFDTPWDATPDPDGQQIYFTATGAQGAGLFNVPAAGGVTRAMAVGQPFVAPRGLAISSDGQQIYVADSQATGGDGRTGRVFVVPVAGGAPAELPGTAGTAPRGLEVARENNADVLYVAGNVAGSSEPAVLRLPLAGGAEVSVVAKGAPLVEPAGIAVAKSGALYVADRRASGGELGSVFRISGANVEVIARDVRTGKPVVGAALTLDESALLVSALAPDRDSAQVLLIELGTLKQGIINKVIEANTGSGGVHRAHNRNFFAWADSTVPGGRLRGGVYALTP